MIIPNKNLAQLAYNSINPSAISKWSLFSITCNMCMHLLPQKYIFIRKYTGSIHFMVGGGLYTYKFCIQVSIQENLNSSLCIHDARNFDEYTQVLAGDTTNQMAFLGGECFPLYCIIMYNCTAKEIKLQKEVNMGS